MKLPSLNALIHTVTLAAAARATTTITTATTLTTVMKCSYSSLIIYILVYICLL
jgi:hypothetical protein